MKEQLKILLDLMLFRFTRHPYDTEGAYICMYICRIFVGICIWGNIIVIPYIIYDLYNK